MTILLFVCSSICFILIRYWKVTVPLGCALIAIGMSNAKDERSRYRGYDPMDFTEAEAQQAIRIMVPAHVDDAGGLWPVTMANNAPRSFQSTFYIVCTATETVLDGTTNWVLGVKQYPYMLRSGDRETVPAKSISTEQFTQATDEMGPHTNLTQCALYTDGMTMASAENDIVTKWVQVTPRGAARAQEIGFKWMNIPQGYNTPDYTSAW